VGGTDEQVADRPRRHRPAPVVVLLRDAPRNDVAGPAAAVAAQRRLPAAPRCARGREPRRSRRLLALSGRATTDAVGLRRHGACSAARCVPSRGGQRKPLRRPAIAAHGMGAVVWRRAVDTVVEVVGACSCGRPSAADRGHCSRDRQPLHARPAHRRSRDGTRLPAHRYGRADVVRASPAGRNEAAAASCRRPHRSRPRPRPGRQRRARPPRGRDRTSRATRGRRARG